MMSTSIFLIFSSGLSRQTRTLQLEQHCLEDDLFGGFCGLLEAELCPKFTLCLGRVTRYLLGAAAFLPISNQENVAPVLSQFI